MRIRTGFSFRLAVGHLDDVVSRFKEIGWKVAPISDYISTFGFNKFTKAAKKAGLRVIYGVELPVLARSGDEKPTSDKWTFFAKSSLRSLHDLIGLATTNCGHEPALTYAQALAANGLIKISGERIQLDQVKLVPKKDFFIGLSPATPKSLFNAARQRGFKFLACGDNVYTRESDLEFYRVTLGHRSNTQTYPQWILSDKEWRAACGYVADKKALDVALKNRNAAMALCNAKMQQASLLVPKKTKTLRQLCVEGAKRTGTDLKNKIYKERLDRELALIEEKNFADYFFVIADMVNWAKQRMIVGPARGSSCGSLVCYLLNITTIDPIPYGLIFERFIDTTRSDLPDIDIDFSDQRRNQVFEYAEDKYGADRVARLGTITMFKPRSALNQAGIALQIPKWQVDKVLDGVIERSGGDSRALQALEDTLTGTEAGRKLLADFPEVKIAARMEGHPNNASQHAAGIVITQSPVAEYVAVDRRTKSAMVDKKDAEDLNLLKIDALGLTQLSIFERTLQLIGKPDKNGWLETLPLNDKKAFGVLNKGHWAGIFQFTGGALQSLTKQIKTKHIEDMISITALARPGPMATGGANSWVKRKTNQEAITTIHPMLTELTKETQGIVVYQEQCMNIMRTIGKFSWEDTSAIRKAMSGRLGNEFFEKYRVNFHKGAKANGIDEAIAEEIFNQTCTFGSWAFNRCACGTTKVKLSNSGGNLPKGGATLAELYRRYEAKKSQWIKQRKMKPWLVSLFPDQRGWPQKAERIIKSGKKVCWRYKFDDGSGVTCTPEHRFIINGEWQQIGKAELGDSFTQLVEAPQPFTGSGEGKGHGKGKTWKIGKNGERDGKHSLTWKNGIHKYKQEFKLKNQGSPCKDCGQLMKRMEVHHNDFNEGRTRPKDLVWLCAGCHKQRHYDRDRKHRWQKGMMPAVKILIDKTLVGLRQTYDIEMPKQHNFMLANGLITHNSHAVAYGLVSYWCCYLKAHHPMEFAAATLDAEADPAKQVALLRELSKEGIDYVAVDPDHSTDRWVPIKKGKKQLLVGPLTSIKGVGPATVIEIMQAREAGKPLRESLAKRLKEAKTNLDTLYPVADKIKQLYPDLERDAKIVTKPTPVINVQCGLTGEVMIIAVVKKIAPKDENEQVNIMKREQNGRRGWLSGPTAALNLFFQDDTDEIFCKVDRYLYPNLGLPIVERGRAGKAIYAIKGTVPPFFRMISITAIRYLGDIDINIAPERIGDAKLPAGEQK